MSLRRYLSLALCFVLLSFVLCSTTSYAQEDIGVDNSVGLYNLKPEDIEDNVIQIDRQFSDGQTIFVYQMNDYHDGLINVQEYDVTQHVRPNLVTHTNFIFSNDDNDILIDKDSSGRLEFGSFVDYVSCKDSDGTEVHRRYLDLTGVNWNCSVMDVGGNWYNVNDKVDVTYYHVGDGYKVALTFNNLNIDIRAVNFAVIYDFNNMFWTWNFDTSVYKIFYGTGVNDFIVDYDIYTNTKDYGGLLGSIIEWLQSIRNGITDTVDNIKSGFNNVVSSITSLPGKIAEAIKGLFVPTYEDMMQYEEKWDELLASRFGAVYQAGSIITDTLGSIQESHEQGTISVPEVSVNLAGTDFTIGGWNVDIIPDGFEFLQTMLKGFFDILCTVLFVNALRDKYEKIMEGR